MKRYASILLVIMLISAVVPLVGSDEYEPFWGDPITFPNAKMHFPQYPDPEGWDVDWDSLGYHYSDIYLADDWMCNETGNVTDIHFWISTYGDEQNYDSIYENFTTWFLFAILEDIPGPPYSHPGNMIQQWLPGESDIDVSGPYYGDEGWYQVNYTYEEHNHQQFWRIDITNMSNPFMQENGTIYWLLLYLYTEPYLFGLKTSQNHWNDNAVYGLEGPGFSEWFPIYDPLNITQPIDFAFVITGEMEEEPEYGDNTTFPNAKMHYPQYPDPYGLDVSWMNRLGDDWQCSETGDVTDIHFWGSTMEDEYIDFDWVNVSIYSDTPTAWSDLYPFSDSSIVQPIVKMLNENHFLLIYKKNYIGKARIGSISNNTITYGAEFNFTNSSDALDSCSIAVLNENKFVLSYAVWLDWANLTKVSCIGTISDMNISFGGTYGFESNPTSASTYVSSLNESKIVITYFNSSGYETAIIGDISDTVITYGNPYLISAEMIGSSVNCYAVNSTYFVALYLNGTVKLCTKIGIVSGSTISFGNEYCANQGQADTFEIAFIGDKKFIVVYKDEGNSDYGTAIIGDISGTTITYGSEYIFNQALTAYPFVDSFDVNEFVISYRDNGNKYLGTVLNGTVSGTVITFGSEKNFYGKMGRTSIQMLNSTSFIISFYEDNNNLGFSIIGDYTEQSYSMPDELLWYNIFNDTQFNLTNPFFGDEGWYDPATETYYPNDHDIFWRVDIENITDPFFQENGTIYWLVIQIEQFPTPPYHGWKTSNVSFNDDAVWYNSSLDEWYELRHPETSESLDFAFVITGEPYQEPPSDEDPGSFHTSLFRPINNAFVTWTPNAGPPGTNFLMVNEPISDDNITYVFDPAGFGGMELYVLGIPMWTYTITNVTLHARVSSNMMGADVIPLEIWDGMGMPMTSPPFVINSMFPAFEDISWTWATDPYGGDWTWASLMAYAFGVDSSWMGTTMGIYMTQFYIEVEYFGNLYPPNITNEDPANNSGYVAINSYLSVDIADFDNDTMNISFYWGNDTLIDSVGDVANGSTASIYIPDYLWMNHSTNYSWYVNITDGELFTVSPLWHFTTCIEYDLVGDGTISYLDVSLLVSHYGEAVTPVGGQAWDINNDGDTNYLDVSSLVSHYGEIY